MATQDIDREMAAKIGVRLYEARARAGVTQEGLGQALGMTFQQVQKYERGTNRISAPVLVRAAQALKHPVSFFLQDFDPEATEAPEPPMDKQVILAARRLMALPDRERRAVTRLIASLSERD